MGATVAGVYEWKLPVKEPVQGVQPGTILPAEDLPKEPVCPYCSLRFHNVNGVRGHASSVHGIRWERKEWGDGHWAARLTKQKELERLQPWHMMMLALKVFYDTPWEDLSTRFHRSENVLKAVWRSPVAREYVARLTAELDPTLISRMVLKDGSVNHTADYLMALEWAKEAKDHNAVARMTEKLMTVTKVAEPEQQAQVVIAQIHLDAKSLLEETVTSTLKEVTKELAPVEVVE